MVAESAWQRLRKRKDFRDSPLKEFYPRFIDELVAETKRKLEEYLLQWPLDNHAKGLVTFCFSQPHTHIKGIRFASWLVCLALAEIYQIEYVWSSDSDTWLLEDVVAMTASTLEGDHSLGATSALIKIERWPHCLAWSQYRCLVLLDSAFTAAHGHSSCITGPSACFRIDALRDILPYWLHHRDALGEGISNEDTVATTWLGRLGWKRGFVTDCRVETIAPSGLLAWIRQQVICAGNRLGFTVAC